MIEYWSCCGRHAIYLIMLIPFIAHKNTEMCGAKEIFGGRSHAPRPHMITSQTKQFLQTCPKAKFSQEENLAMPYFSHTI